MRTDPVELTFEQAYNNLAPDMKALHSERDAYDYALAAIGKAIGQGTRHARTGNTQEFIVSMAALIFKVTHALEALGKWKGEFLVEFNPRDDAPPTAG